MTWVSKREEMPILIFGHNSEDHFLIFFQDPFLLAGEKTEVRFSW